MNNINTNQVTFVANNMSVINNLRSFNFSVYAQYFNYINIILCLALGISNLFHINPVIAFGIIAIVQSLIIFFLEIPFFIKICPLSDNFINFIKKFESNLYRSIFYLFMSLIQWFSIFCKTTSLIAVAIGLLISSAFYFIAFLKGQNFWARPVVQQPIDDNDDAFNLEFGNDPIIMSK